MPPIPPLVPGPRLPAPGFCVPYIPNLPLSSTGDVHRSPDGEQEPLEPCEFPPGFLWGAAMSAQQIEGAAHEDGREDSIWDAFARVPGAILDRSTPEVACDHYHRTAQDIALMQAMHLGAYRFSTSWARIMPDGKRVNPRGLEFYSRLVDDLLAADVVPFLTLYHWDLPQVLQERHGGWPNRDTAYRFVDYALTVHEALGDRVRSWTTINEPWCAAYLGYIAGEHAPGHHNRAEGVAAGHHLLLAHGLAAEALKAENPSAVLGIALNLWQFDPADPENPADVAAGIKKDGTDNRVFADPVFRGAYPDDVRDWLGADLERVVRDGDLAVISTPIDTFGLNYYNGSAIVGVDPATTPPPVDGPPTLRGRHWTQGPSPAPEGIGYGERDLPTTAMGWAVQPEGMTRLLERLQRDYTGPRGVSIYITENGAAYDDVPDPSGYVDDSADRLRFIDAHLRATKDALEAGVDVRGYFAWSLLDTFEWAWGYGKRFGIVRTDFTTQARIPKASGQWYARVARDNALGPVG